jgi:hypothetical protein
MIIVEILLKEPLEVAFAQHDYMIQALAANTPDEVLHIRILPRTPWGDHDFLDPHVVHALPKRSTVDTIPVAQKITWRFIPRKRVDDLLRRPLCSGMLCHVDVHDPSPFVGEDHEHEEHLTGERRHHKEVQGDQIFDVGFEEGLPRRRG